MKMRALVISSLTLTLFLSGPASAEGGCPAGETPNNVSAPIGSAESMNSCIPIPTVAPVSPRWKSRWGAVASDSAGIYGISENEANEKKARKSALAKCKQEGGESCSIAMTYVNQCLSIATSDVKSNVARAPDINAAEQDSLMGCNRRSSGKACAIFYSGCSLPVRAN
ncbi:DUF4189 domain-containing protein [Lysobacter sp. CA196]|uniref:DUF4189 domain-containing protein n=1 Tax=Lysobacter sp. CA196 TaxID=3455606 RepID=UPI003F8D5CD4